MYPPSRIRPGGPRPSRQAGGPPAPRRRAAGRPGARPGRATAVTTRTPSAPMRWTISRTTRLESRAGARRTTDGPPPSRASSTERHRPTAGRVDGDRRCRAAAARGCATTRDGEAVPRNDETGPAHRHAAHSATATSDGGGPRPLETARSSGWTPGSGVTSSSTTQAPTRRPCRGTRTRLPTPTACRPGRAAPSSRSADGWPGRRGRPARCGGRSPPVMPTPAGGRRRAGRTLRGRAPASGRRPARCPPT